MLSLYTKKGKLKGEPASVFFGFGSSFYRDTIKKGEDKKRMLLELGSALYQTNNEDIMLNDILIVDVVYSEGNVEIHYISKGSLNIECAYFDCETKEFYTTPIRLDAENRFYDFRSKSAKGFIGDILSFREINKGS